MVGDWLVCVCFNGTFPKVFLSSSQKVLIPLRLGTAQSFLCGAILSAADFWLGVESSQCAQHPGGGQKIHQLSEFGARGPGALEWQ